jgi:hypothetical protein
MYGKPLRAGLIFGMAVFAVSAFAAVTYDFKQVIKSDFKSDANSEVAGTGMIDGNRSRMVLLRGSTHSAGTYIISHHDSQTTFIVDPVNKRFSEIQASKLSSAFNTGQIQIANLKTGVARLNDHPVIAGLPTDHYRITASYDITVKFGALPLRQSVVTKIDKWVTQAFGELSDLHMTRASLRTGNPEVDKLIELESTRVKGFPLRQVTTIQTTATEVGQTPKSQLRMKPTRMLTTDLTITRIAKAQVDPMLFDIPKSFAKVEADASNEPVGQMISMEP